MNPGPSKVAANPTVPSPRSPQNAHAAIALRNEKHCESAHQARQIKDSIRHRASSPSTGSDKQKKVGTAARDWGCGPSAHCRRGSVRAEGQQRGRGTGKRSRDWSAKRCRPGTSIPIGTLEGLCNGSACAWQHPDPSCTIHCHPVESLPWHPPARHRASRIVEAGLSWLLRGCWVFWPGTHARHGLKRLVVLGQRRCAAAQFSLTQYNHAWPRADRGHQINRTGSPLTDPPRPHETYSHHANVRPRSLSPRPPRPLRPGPSLTAFALTNRLPMPPCFCRAT